MNRLVLCATLVALTPAIAASQPLPGGIPPISEMPWTPQMEGGRPKEEGFAVYQTIPGKPIQIRPRENVAREPAFPEQTRAPFRGAPTAYTMTAITQKLNLPWGLVELPSGKWLVTEKNPGRLLVIDSRGNTSEVTGLAPASRSPKFGLLNVVVDPRFAENKTIYFSFFELMWRSYPAEFRAPSVTFSSTNVARGRLDEVTNTLRDVKTIFRSTPQMVMNPSLRMGGGLAFDRENNLLVTIGPRTTDNPTDAAISQQLDSTLGKVIRITRDGEPAPGNPYIGAAGVAPEIWAIGFRSPEGFTVDAASGNVWLVDHGMRGGDELNLIGPGKNYGWPAVTYGQNYNGTPLLGNLSEKPGMEGPKYYWDPVIAPSSVAVYNASLFPGWKGNVLVGGLRGKLVSRLSLDDAGKVIAEEPLFAELKTPIRNVTVGRDGAVYILTEAGGFWRVTPKP